MSKPTECSFGGRVAVLTCLVALGTIETGCTEIAEPEKLETVTQVQTGTTMNTPAETNEWAVRLVPGTDGKLFAEQHGAVYVGTVGTLPDTYLLRYPDEQSHDAKSKALKEDARVLWSELQVTRQWTKKPQQPAQ